MRLRFRHVVLLPEHGHLRNVRVPPSARATPDRITTDCDLNITLMAELGLLLIFR
jgi:hypothetical protein